MINTKTILGQRLIDNSLISSARIEEALSIQAKTGQLLGKIIEEKQWIEDQNAFYKILAEHLGVEFVGLKERAIDPSVIAVVPAPVAVHYRCVPFRLERGVLSVATNSPSDIHLLDEISLAVSFRVQLALASERDIDEVLKTYYGVGAETIARMMDKAGEEGPKKEDVEDIGELDADASIKKFLNQVLLEAYKVGSTDIHIEPFLQELRVRYRVDGVLCDAKVPKNIIHFQDAICSRVKILANLDIVEKRLPQDGRFKVRVGTVDLDLRVSFLPVPLGESVVLRILNEAHLYSLEQLGLEGHEEMILQEMMRKPHGIIFVTGPTGSGKTTTLYACLSRLNGGPHKIITIEDPIEYQLKGVTQVQINPSIGLTFAQGLRSMLRHDPDIMMVGEVRDKETAATAVQVALTGHLIFSTLHTNDAASGVTRLLDMGIEPYLITSTVQCFIAQRLVRCVCGDCRRKVVPGAGDAPAEEEQELLAKGHAIYRARGCASCHGAGYKGRVAIYEFLVLTDELRALIINRASTETIKAAAIAAGMKTLYQSGLEKVKKGATTFEEIMRVTQGGA